MARKSSLKYRVSAAVRRGLAGNAMGKRRGIMHDECRTRSSQAHGKAYACGQPGRPTGAPTTPQCATQSVYHHPVAWALRRPDDGAVSGPTPPHLQSGLPHRGGREGAAARMRRMRARRPAEASVTDPQIS